MIRVFNTCAGNDQGSDGWYAVEDPALLLQVGEAPSTSERDLDNAVDAANDALKGWRQNQRDRCLSLKQ
jgi:acyl-CoA reductase-like NAD-dependent aldehyde dehydrogenase